MESEKRRQPTMKHHMILSRISKQNILIRSETVHFNKFVFDNLEYKQWQNMMFETEVN
jgi:hypothetical protein